MFEVGGVTIDVGINEGDGVVEGDGVGQMMPGLQSNTGAGFAGSSNAGLTACVPGAAVGAGRWELLVLCFKRLLVRTGPGNRQRLNAPIGNLPEGIMC
jgi:hypothetical protein